ncbi:hypothetical protein [Nocardioides halotolerans]|uniref:hypothetical protein n=1 Tax=Nocardioides halotolerans TaxID=433660 RepID=UPI00048C7973|nr:hypothetical protein [Nocardioides halotolerans]
MSELDALTHVKRVVVDGGVGVFRLESQDRAGAPQESGVSGRVCCSDEKKVARRLGQGLQLNEEALLDAALERHCRR